MAMMDVHLKRLLNSSLWHSCWNQLLKVVLRRGEGYIQAENWYGENLKGTLVKIGQTNEL